MERVAVVDYGMGNLRSVAKALERVAGPSQEVVVSTEPNVIAAADRLVFPGQGAIRDCMAELKRFELIPVIREGLQNKPFLGICMGLQALLESSEEHPGTQGLGVLAGDVKRFPDSARDPVTGERLKIPHMGWNTVTIARPHPLWKDIANQDRFYFVHSYYVAPEETEVVTGRTQYAVDFVSAVARDGFFAVQFHPEKSQRAGLTLLKNFLEWDGSGP